MKKKRYIVPATVIISLPPTQLMVTTGGLPLAVEIKDETNEDPGGGGSGGNNDDEDEDPNGARQNYFYYGWE